MCASSGHTGASMLATVDMQRPRRGGRGRGAAVVLVALLSVSKCMFGAAFNLSPSLGPLRLAARGGAATRAPLHRSSRLVGAVLPGHRRKGRCVAGGWTALFGGFGKKEGGGTPDIDVPTFFEMPDRVVAVGDVHGDVEAMLGCLRIAKMVNEAGDWIGGTSHFVQLGDIMDRGDNEKSCVDWLFHLKRQAAAAGGAVHILIGNHEVMNVDMDFRYVTPGSWEGWADQKKSGTLMVNIADSVASLGYPAYMKERVSAFRPGGTTSKLLSHMPCVVQIGDSVFVHGGLRIKHVEYGLEKLNRETAAWLEGAPRFKAAEKPSCLDQQDSPVWARLYSVPKPKRSSGEELDEVLRRMNAKRMVVGHTPQLRGINAFVTETGAEVWRCDTGMSSGMMSGPLECLEVLADGTVHVLTVDGVVPADVRSGDVDDEEMMDVCDDKEMMDVCDVDTGLCTPTPEDLELLNLTQQGGVVEKGTVVGPERIPLSLSAAETAEVARLIGVDDKSLAIQPRLTFILEQLIADAISRQDKTLTKKTVKDMLRMVVGRKAVEDEREHINKE
ncbi:Metallo-dependent phosphatase-like protein, partial [Baffinella frigidus]